MIYSALALTLWNVFNFNSELFFNETQGDLLPEGSYTTTSLIFSTDQEYYGEDSISMVVVNDTIAIDVRREYNKQQTQCVGSILYAKGTFERQVNSIVVNFSKVLDQKMDQECVSRRQGSFHSTQSVNEYVKNNLILVSTYRDELIQCFESEVFGGLCFNKE